MTTTIRARIVALAERPGGATNADMKVVTRCTTGQVGSHLAVLTTRGDVFMAVSPGDRRRYFGTDAEAREYERTRSATLRDVRETLPGLRKRCGQEPLLLPGSADRGKRSAPTSWDGVTRITVGPSMTYDPRYQVAPGVVPYGAGFAALPMGLYLSAEDA